MITVLYLVLKEVRPLLLKISGNCQNRHLNPRIVNKGTLYTVVPEWKHTKSFHQFLPSNFSISNFGISSYIE